MKRRTNLSDRGAGFCLRMEIKRKGESVSSRIKVSEEEEEARA